MDLDKQKLKCPSTLKIIDGFGSVENNGTSTLKIIDY